MKLKLLRDMNGKKAGEVVDASESWAAYALRSGIAKRPEKKTKTATKPDTEED